MKLKMLTGLVGPKISLARNDPHECGSAEAIRLIDARFAVAENPEEEAAARAELAKAETSADVKAAEEAKAQQGAAETAAPVASSAKKPAKKS